MARFGAMVAGMALSIREASPRRCRRHPEGLLGLAIRREMLSPAPLVLALQVSGVVWMANLPAEPVAWVRRYATKATCSRGR
jgi:hypothetical protein